MRQKHDVQSDLAKGKVFIVTENIVRVVTCLHNIERNFPRSYYLIVARKRITGATLLNADGAPN